MSESTPRAPAPDLRKLAVLRATHWLIGAGAKFAIEEADGTRHGDLEVVERKLVTRGPRRHPFGAVTAYVMTFVQNMKVGDSVVIPWGPYGASKVDSDSLRGTISSKCGRIWGRGTFLTAERPEGVEVLRASAQVDVPPAAANDPGAAAA